MPPYRLWWLVALLLASSVSANDSQCPCVPQEACPHSDNPGPLKSYTSCEDETLVRCCNEPLQMVSADLLQEQKFMEAIDNLMEKMQHIAVPVGEHREDKSLGGTTKNALNCDGKHCQEELGGTKDEPIHEPLSDSLSPNQPADESITEVTESLNEETQTNFTHENHKENEGKNKLLIVYAENPNDKTAHEHKQPVIVYPNKEAAEEYLQSEESSLVPQKLAKKDNNQEDGTEENQGSEGFGKLKPNFHKLFPKRNPPLKSTHSQTNPDDLKEAGSDIEEVKTSVLANSQEQTVSRKPLRSFHRQSQKPTTTDDSTQTNIAFEPLRGSRIRPGLNNTSRPEIQSPAAAIMDEINVKALNDMMKTNFTTRPSFQRRQRPSLHAQTRLHSTTSTISSSPSGRSQQDQRTIPQSPNPPTNESLMRAVSVERNTNTTATDLKGSKYTIRQRNQYRNQNLNPPPKGSIAVSMSQEQVFDTLKEDTVRRRPSYRRLPTRTQSEASTSNLADQINAQDSTFGKRRTKFRPRSKFENTTPARQDNRAPTEAINVHNTDAPINNTSSIRTNQNVGHAAPVTPAVVYDMDEEFEGDLESSGTVIHPQGIRGRFSPPPSMEQGFQPMFGPAELHVVGHVPSGFHDRAKGFQEAELGFELPRANQQTEFAGPEQFQQFDTDEEMQRTSRLLPPVFPVPQQQPTISSSDSSSFSSDTYSDEDLLPPLQKPMPLSVTLNKMMSPAAENLMLDQHRDITQLNQEFNNLKTRYDMLLNRYAETLKIYNEKYRNLFNSNEDSIK